MILIAFTASTLTLAAGAQDSVDPPPSPRYLLSLDSEPVLPWEIAGPEPRDPLDMNVLNYVAPVFEIVAFEALLNLFDRTVIDEDAYGVDRDSIRANLHHHWVLDTDPFSTNMLQHPYSGALFYGFARSAGHGFEVSFLYAAFGSVLWEYAGETTEPSINDLIMTSVGGSFLGEALFRMANLLLRSGGENPGVLRQAGAAVLLPSATVDVYGNKVARNFQNQDPAIFVGMSFGGAVIVQDSHTEGNNVGDWNGLVDVSLVYGLPGQPGYEYTRPFDYFAFEFSGSNDARSGLDNVMIRGLLYGAPYESGTDYRGIWGLYGTYDYISQDTFRVGTSALSLGTTAQWWLSRTLALQGTVMGGCGFGATGNVAPVGERDYVYGVMPQGLLTLRLIYADRVMVEATGRDYYVRGTGSDNRYATQNNAHADATLSVRLFGPVAVGIRYAVSERGASYKTLTPSDQLLGSLGFTVSFLGNSGFGAVEWRNLDGQ